MKTIADLYKELAAIITKPEADRRMRNWLVQALRKAKKVEPVKKVSADFNAMCERIIIRFKEITGFNPRLTKPLQANIKARMNEGYVEEDFGHVFEVKAHDWLGDAEKRQHLNLGTLLRPSNFPKYVEQWGIWQATQKNPKRFTTEAQRSQELKQWFRFADLGSLSTYYRGLGEELQEIYDLPGYVDDLLQKLPLARLRKNVPELEKQFAEMKKTTNKR